ncbi:MAG: helix-turn-helix domain-containing protein [Erysipelotrichaceae bacterium]
MSNFTNRQLSILFFLVEKGHFATAEQLAEFSGSSVRSVRSDVCSLNSVLSNDATICINSTPAKGYQLEIINPSQYKEFEARIIAGYGFYKKVGVDKTLRRLHILQRMLSSERVKNEELAEELFLTKSALKYDLAWTNDFFHSYQIKVVSESGKGSYLVGDEKSIRLAMVETFCSQYLKIESAIEIEEFRKEFYDDFDYYQEIRRAFLKIIRERKYSMKDISTKKLSTYLVLIKKRVASGKTISLNYKEKKEIINTYEFELTKKTFKINHLFEDVEMSEDELYFFTILLICHRDLDLLEKNDEETVNKQFLGETVKGYEKIVDNLIANNTFSFYRMELFQRFRNHMISSLYTIYVGEKYHQNQNWLLTTYYELSEFEFSPLAIQFARCFLFEAESVYQTKINVALVDRYIVLFDLILKRINFDFKKRRIAIVSLAGRLAGREYKDYILERFQPFIDYIDIFNQYEMRRINFEDYDVAITDGILYDNFYPLEFVQFRILSLQSSKVELFEHAFIKGYSTEVIDYLSNITSINLDFECSSYQILFKMLSFKYGGTKAHDFEQILLKEEKMYSFFNQSSMIAMIICDRSKTNSDFVDIYISNNKMMWDSCREVKCIICVSLDKSLNMVKLKTLNKLLHCMWNNLKVCLDICRDASTTYQDIFKDIIRSHFLSK